MTTDTTERIKSNVFSRTFEQMCNFIAVSKTGDANETVRGLITLCLLEFPGDSYSTSICFKRTIETLFGIVIPDYQIEKALDGLEKSGVISRPTNDYKLDQKVKEVLSKKIKEATGLEERVKSKWFVQLETSHPTLPVDDAWRTLRVYLSRTFRRHGIQAAALLDPTIDTPAEHEISLSTILKDSIQENLPVELHKSARPAITDFLAHVGDDADRSHYVAQLADGAFSFYTLEVPQELSKELRSQLHELTLFLDTNFLFGILDLHYNSQVQVSHDLLRAITSQKFPFKLRYHEKTAIEMTRTITNYGAALKSRQWTGSLSRAASQSKNISGIEQKFHERNVLHSIDVDEFLRPYEHFDKILEAKNINIYKPAKDDREQARTDLYYEYKEFLKSNNRDDKGYEIVMHDATVLETARQLRSKASSTLHAEALIITCDYFLYRFDWESARRNGHKACVLLPNIFWQILRPFITVTQDFEKAFAETFALPEFRTLSSGGVKACSKMLQILATYKDVPEETAFNLLSNDLLLDNLKTASNDKQFAEQVEAAFIEENRDLMEEKVMLKQRLLEEKQLREERELDLSKTEKALKEKEQTIAEHEIKFKAKEAALHSLEQQKLQDNQKINETVEQVIKEQREKQSANTRSEILRQKIIDTENKSIRIVKIACITVAIFVVVFFEITVNNLIKWNWLLTHANSYALQACFSSMLFFIVIGIGVKSWRKGSLLGAFFAVFCVALQLLGGPPSNP